jgi:hypothetical protein
VKVVGASTRGVASATWPGGVLVESIVVLPEAVEALSLDSVVERVTIRDEPRRTLRCINYDRLVAIIAGRAQRHERRQRTLLRGIARAESLVEASQPALLIATAGLEESLARVERLNEAVAAVNQALAAMASAEQVLDGARSQLGIAKADAERLEGERAALERAVDSAQARVRAYEAVDDVAPPWDDAELHERIEQARSSAAEAQGLVADASALLPQALGTAVDAHRCREALLQAAAECRRRLEARCHLEDGGVRAALHAYEEAAAGRGVDAHAFRLADELIAIGDALDEAKAANHKPQPTEEDLQAGRERVAAAADHLDDVTRHRDRDLLTAEERAELEEAHQVVASRERRRHGKSGHSGRRPRLRRARARHIADAQARLDSLLVRHGYADFLDYRLHHAHGERSATQAVAQARAQLEAAHSALAALEHANGPSEEERELEVTRTELLREGVALLGYDPGEHLPEVLRVKADVPGALTTQLVAALTDARVTTLSHAVDVEAHAWLLACEAEQRACSDVEAQLVVIDAQLTALDRVGPGPAELAAVRLAVETIVTLAGDRAQYAERMAELLDAELAARRDAAERGQADASRGRDWAASADALRWLIGDDECRRRHELETAEASVAEAMGAMKAARAQHGGSRRDLAELISGRPDAPALIADALRELDGALTAAAHAHEEAVAATARHGEARTLLSQSRERMALHACSAPPALAEQPGPMDVVMASRWVANRDDHPVVVLVATRADTEGVGPEVVGALLELSRQNWVITTTQVVQAAIDEGVLLPVAPAFDLGPRARGGYRRTARGRRPRRP